MNVQDAVKQIQEVMSSPQAEVCLRPCCNIRDRERASSLSPKPVVVDSRDYPVFRFAQVKCVVLRASGEIEEIVIDQRNIKDVIQGVPTIVGGVRALDIMAVARRDNKGKKNAHKLPDTFDANIKGDIVLLKTAEDATPLDFAKKAWTEWVAAGMVDDAAEEEDRAEQVVVELEQREARGGARARRHRAARARRSRR